MAAEIVGQLDDAVGVFGTHGGQMLAIHRDVGTAETVDGLLRIADDAQTLAGLPRELRDHIDLQLIGVLELVDHDHLEPVGIAPRDLGAVPQRPCRERQQIGIVEHPGFALALRENARNQRGYLDKRLEVRAHDARAQLGRDALVARHQLGQQLLVRRSLAEPLAGDGKPTRHREGLEIGQRRSVGQRAIHRGDGLLREHQELIARLAGLHLARQRAGVARRVAQLHQQFLGARRRGRAHHRAHPIGACLGDGHQLAHHALHRDAERAALGSRLEFGEQRVDAPGVDAAEAVDHVIMPADNRLQRVFQHGSRSAFVDDVELRVYPQLKRMRTQDARACAVDRRNPGVVNLERLLGHARAAQRAFHARFDFPGGLGRERDGQDLVDIGEVPAFERMDDAPGQRERLARSGTRGNREGPIKRIDACLLPCRQSHVNPSFRDTKPPGTICKLRRKPGAARHRRRACAEAPKR